MDQFLIDQIRPGHVRLSCRGDLDLLNRAELGAACHEALELRAHRLVVDLDRVDFIDCGSVRLLDQAAAIQEDQGGSFVTVCNDEFILRVLDLTGFTSRRSTVPRVPSSETTRLSWRDRARPSVRRAAR